MQKKRERRDGKKQRRLKMHLWAIFFREGKRQQWHGERGLDKPDLAFMPRCILKVMTL